MICTDSELRENFEFEMNTCIYTYIHVYVAEVSSKEKMYVSLYVHVHVGVKKLPRASHRNHITGRLEEFGLVPLYRASASAGE